MVYKYTSFCLTYVYKIPEKVTKPPKMNYIHVSFKWYTETLINIIQWQRNKINYLLSYIPTGTVWISLTNCWSQTTRVTRRAPWGSTYSPVTSRARNSMRMALWMNLTTFSTNLCISRYTSDFIPFQLWVNSSIHWIGLTEVVYRGKRVKKLKFSSYETNIYKNLWKLNYKV